MADKKQMIESAANEYGFTVQGWREDEDGPVGVLGRMTVVEDDEDNGLYVGDEGELVASVVGAEEFRNQRVSFGFKTEDQTDPNEVPDLDVLEQS